jgi:hypothetical protein
MEHPGQSTKYGIDTLKEKTKPSMVYANNEEIQYLFFIVEPSFTLLAKVLLI